MGQQRRTAAIVGVGVLLLVAVAAGVWWRQKQPTPAVAPAVQLDHSDAGLLRISDMHRAVIAEARQLVPQLQSALSPPEPVTDVVASPGPDTPPSTEHIDPFADLPQSRQLLIGFSGGALGDTDPCGCAHNPLGGLAKRVRWWQRTIEGRRNTLLLGTGGDLVPSIPDVIDRPGEALARADVFFRAMAKAQYAAMNVGAHELALGVGDLRRIAKARGVPLLSANIYGKDGQPAFERKLTVQVGMMRVGIVGLVTSSPPDGVTLQQAQGLEIRPPVQAGQQVIGELEREGCDMIIVLSQMSRQEIDALVNQAPGIDLVLGSQSMDLTNDLIATGNGYFADTYTKGKYMGLLTVGVRAATGRHTRLYARNMRAALDAQRLDLASQIQQQQVQLDQSLEPGSPIRMDKETREVVGHQLAALRARLQRVTLEIESVGDVPKDGNGVALEMIGMSQDVLDDPEVLKWIDKFKEKYPKIAGR